jgi:4-amino-4-deoxy-L-arabinose transferase-like glycosyltransferase
MAAGSVLATPDSPVMVTTCFLLLGLAKLAETGGGRWWLVVGIAFGLGMFSKYSTLFFALSILIWVLAVPDLRKWLISPWPWLGALVALLIFSPVLVWNAQHDWASVRFQANRLIVHDWSLRYLAEFFLTQLGLATPPVFVLGCMGLFGLLRFRTGPLASRVLISAMVWPIVIYFVWHTFHGRVQGNWPEPAYPAFVVAAAVAADLHPWRGSPRRWVVWSKRLALPVGLAISAFVYLQALFGLIPAGYVDPTARALGAGWPDLAFRIDEIRKNAGAGIVLTANYGLASWLAFYLPSHPPVEQTNGRMRWVDAPAPNPELFKGPMLFVCSTPCKDEARLTKSFDSVAQLAVLERQRNGVGIEQYSVYRLFGPRAPVFDQP